MKYKPQYIPCSVLMTKNANLCFAKLCSLLYCAFMDIFLLLFILCFGFFWNMADLCSCLHLKKEIICKCLAYSR